MARAYARFKISIWSDPDWRAMSIIAQGFYTSLVTDPGISMAGIVDWRPNRLAHRSFGATAETIRAAAAELQDGLKADGSGPARFVIVDEDTEEILVRSFVRHDELLKSPNMTTAMCNAHGAIGSPLLQSWVAWEAWRGIRDDPSLNGARVVRERLTEPDRNPSDPVPIRFDPGSIVVPIRFPYGSQNGPSGGPPEPGGNRIERVPSWFQNGCPNLQPTTSNQAASSPQPRGLASVGNSPPAPTASRADAVTWLANTYPGASTSIALVEKHLQQAIDAGTPWDDIRHGALVWAEAVENGSDPAYFPALHKWLAEKSWIGKPPPAKDTRSQGQKNRDRQLAKWAAESAAEAEARGNHLKAVEA